MSKSLKNINKFKKRLVICGVGYVLILAILGKVIGDSYLLALVAIAGWVLLFAAVMKYLALKKNAASSERKDRL